MHKLVVAKPNCNVGDRSVAGAAALIEQQVARDEVFLAINGFPFFHLSIIARTVTADFHPCRAQCIIHEAGTVEFIRAAATQDIRFALLRQSCLNKGGNTAPYLLCLLYTSDAADEL